MYAIRSYYEQDFMLDQSNSQGASEAELYIQAKTETALGKVIQGFHAYCRSHYPEAAIAVAPPPNIFEKVFASRSAPLEIRLKNSNGNELPKPEEIDQITTEVVQLTGIKA